MGPSDIMPCFSMSCAAALVITVNRMKAKYFMFVPRRSKQYWEQKNIP
jgi:hypothetical protein